MGKYGAYELNYSSDIDFCVFYDPEELCLARPERAERTLIRFVQTLIRGFDHYAAIEDIHSIKRQIQARRIEGITGAGLIDPAGHHLKLGSGGIREIEFYAQTQQLILGGRNPSLRSPRTVDALAALAKGGFIGADEAATLTAHYGQLRRFEHAAQMREDAQTHDAPKDPQARGELARLSAYDDLASFDAALSEILTQVHRLYVALFPGFESLTLEDGNLSFTGVEPDPETLKTLTKLGFNEPAQIWRQMADWLRGRISATRSERARALLT